MGAGSQQLKRVEKFVEEYGYRVTLTRNSHLKIMDGEHVVTVTGSTPSKTTAWRNFQTDVKRYARNKNA